MADLKTLKLRVDHLLMAIGAVVVVVGAVLIWRLRQPEPEQVELDEGLERMRARHNPAAAEVPRFVRPFYAGSGSRNEDENEGEGLAILQPPPQNDPGVLGPEEAVDTFAEVIGELELAVESGRKLGPTERAELYNRATGSFTALSAWTDSSDPAERALVDDAYARMMSLLRELDIKPPAHDPDYNPLRR